MDPTTSSFVDTGNILSKCLRLRTNHQSTANIANAIILMPAHKPTYLDNATENENLVQLDQRSNGTHLNRNFSMS